VRQQNTKEPRTSTKDTKTTTNKKEKQVCVQLSTYTDNVALPAFTHRYCCVPTMQQSVSPACQAHSSKPAMFSEFAAVGPCWDRQTDGQTPYHYTDPAPHTVWAVPIKSTPRERHTSVVRNTCIVCTVDEATALRGTCCYRDRVTGPWRESTNHVRRLIQ